jgi:hypothetical protein
MHIHANNNLLLASLGTNREEVHEIQARRAAEVRRKLSLASRTIPDSDELSGAPRPVEARSYKEEHRQGEDDSFGSLFSARA